MSEPLFYLVFPNLQLECRPRGFARTGMGNYPALQAHLRKRALSTFRFTSRIFPRTVNQLVWAHRFALLGHKVFPGAFRNHLSVSLSPCVTLAFTPNRSSSRPAKQLLVRLRPLVYPPCARPFWCGGLPPFHPALLAFHHCIGLPFCGGRRQCTT